MRAPLGDPADGQAQVDFVTRQTDSYSAGEAIQNFGRDLALRVADAAHSLADEAAIAN